MHRPEIEALDRESLRDVQSDRLGKLVARLKSVEAPYWSEKMGGVPDVSSIDEIETLPFTNKAEFRETYPFGMLTVPRSNVVRIHASSGTSGKPTIVAYTIDDVGIFAEVNARSIAAAGGTADDVLQVSYGYGLFTGGLGLHFGGETLGATTVPASGGNPGFQVGLMADVGATGLAATPSFALILAEKADELGLKDKLQLRFGVHGAEPWSEGLRAKLEAAWDRPYDACDIYGLSEVIGPGVAIECRENKGGMHIQEDHFFPEIVDPETGEPVADGESGELVLTTLTKTAQPVIRYRTRDITRFIQDACPCGRTTRRIARLEGRADDMLIIRGINVYPKTIETVLMADEDLGSNYAIIVDRRGSLPELGARVEVANEWLASSADIISERLEARLLEVVRLRVQVEVGPPGSIPRSPTGKAKRVFEQTSDEDPIPYR